MEVIIIIFIGCLVVALFDAIGSILSRRLNFKYSWFVIGSILIYGFVAIYAIKYENLIIGVLTSAIVGVFDSTIGLIISKKLNANISDKDTEYMKITPKMIFSVSLFASIIGYLSILIIKI